LGRHKSAEKNLYIKEKAEFFTLLFIIFLAWIVELFVSIILVWKRLVVTK